MKLRIATFNCENLFNRYKFKDDVDPRKAADNGFERNDLAFRSFDRVARRLTAKAIKEISPDVICLQEVENRKVLERFRSKFLGGTKSFPHTMVIDGNDPRYIDVAVLSKHPITHARSYTHLKKTPQSRSKIFSRDCLEVDVQAGAETITLFCNHFKSMMGGRAKTKPRRDGQVKEVREIVEDRFGSHSPGNKHWIILGDLNDYVEEGDEGSSSLTPLLNWNQIYDASLELPEEERYTHYFPKERAYRQLDYILVSKKLKAKISSVEVERRGMPKRAARITETRFRGVGQRSPKSSDHCPLLVELEF